MQNTQQLHRTARRLRKGFFHSLITLGLLIPLALGITRADPAPAPPPQTSQAAASAKPATSAKTAAPAKSPTASATAKPQPAVPQLPVIVVTAATRNTQPVDTTATSTTVITHDDIENNQYISVTQALMSVPGLAVVPSGAPGQVTSVFTRGTDSNMTLFTIDGRHQPVGLDGAYDFTNLTLDNVDQIEVVRTPSSSLQGGNATGGTINLVTLAGRGLATPESSVSFEGGSFDTFRENIQSRGMVGNFDYAVSASNEDSDMNRPNENYRNTVYRGNFGYQVTPDVYLDLHTGYSLANAGSPNTIVTPDPVARLQTEDWFISPEVTAKVTDFYTTKLFYNHDQQRQGFVDPYTSPDGFSILPQSTQLQINTDSLDWQNDIQIARNWRITAGIQADNSNVNQFTDYNEFDFPPVFGMTTLENSLFNIGGYVESQWQPIQDLNVLSSVRDDHYSDYSGAVSWRQGVSYRIAPTQTVVHASGASSYTPPSLQDLYFPGYSNPNLKPESSLGWEVGVEQPLAGGKVTPSATYFHNSITDYIQDDANFIPQNIGRATTEGAEIDIKAAPTDQLALDLNYTYLTADNDTSDIRLVRRPRNSLNFTAIWTPIQPLTLSMGGSWVVGRQDYDPVTFEQIEAPDYFVLRASATYRINKYVTLWVRGENLTDDHYQPVLGYPALGLGGYGGIKISF
ncbi:MAG TPA: TonB-dependent receptor [Candidatus Methylacidiphilales bacterium]|nr:TonB-dependent receptor [Candidatus Methylacidiphilales bacterium]